jgi:glutathione S-transferase
LTPRWFNWTPREALPAHPNVRSWYERLAARPAYQEHVIKVNAKRTQVSGILAGHAVCICKAN